MTRRTPIVAPEPWLYTMVDLVGILRLSETAIRKMIRQGRFPRPVYPVEGAARWTRPMLEAYQAAVEYLPAIGQRRKKKSGKPPKPPRPAASDRA